jgi:hypothetical protein
MFCVVFIYLFTLFYAILHLFCFTWHEITLYNFKLTLEMYTKFKQHW